MQERYRENLIEFVTAKNEYREYLDESTAINYTLQLLSALKFLHSKNYIHAPGEINPNRVYFNEAGDEIYLDVGRSASSISAEWLLENAQELLASRMYIIV
jgi:serine/threonine protein kinase